MTPALQEACRRAVHLVKSDGITLRAGKASVFILRGIGYRKTAAVMSIPPISWLVEVGYWIVARNRLLFSRFLFRKR